MNYVTFKRLFKILFPLSVMRRSLINLLAKLMNNIDGQILLLLKFIKIGLESRTNL